MPLESRVLFLFLGIFLPVGSHLADYGPSHIFNPEWPPHAKFHTGQTLGFSILLGLCTIFFAFRKTSDKAYAVLATSMFASAYWITQACAIFYPGTAFVDPQYNSPSAFIAGIPAQLVIDAFAVALTTTAAYLAMRKKARWA